jgi:prolyl-tRNA synthetase
MEVAESQLIEIKKQDNEIATEVFTGEHKSIEDVSKFLKIDATDTIKAVVFITKDDFKPIIVFLRGDLDVNESKLKKIVRKEVLPYDSDNDESLAFGNIGPQNLPENITVIYDQSIQNREGMVVGANKAEYHISHFNVKRDLSNIDFVDVAKVKEGDKCKFCGNDLELQNGIEIGNIFQLGTKYTEAMGMTILNEKGEAVNPIMGCYGIGVGRAIASIVQDNNDEKGMILPKSVAPWLVHICPIRLDNDLVRDKAFALYNELNEMGIESLIDDRDISAGVKFADADLIGMPFRVVVSPKGLEKGEMEIKIRETGEVIIVSADKIIDKIKELR